MVQQFQMVWVRLQIEGAEGQIREQAERLSHMKALQSEADSLQSRLGELQQHSAATAEEARLVPGLKSQVTTLTKQVGFLCLSWRFCRPGVLCNLSRTFCSVMTLQRQCSACMHSARMQVSSGLTTCIKMRGGNVQLSPRMQCLHFSVKPYCAMRSSLQSLGQLK